MSQPRSNSQTRSPSGSRSGGSKLPPNINETIRNIVLEVGPHNISMSSLRERLESKYSMDFNPFKEKLLSIVQKLLRTPEFQKILTPKSGGKRSRSSQSQTKGGSRKAKTEDADDNTSQRRGRRVKKPDNYPKSALSAYILFSNACRDRIQRANPDAKITEVSKLIATEWRNAAPNVRSQYEKQAADDKRRYEKEMKTYLDRGGEVFKRGRREGGKRAKKDPNAPKRALSAYMFFAQDFRNKNSSLSITEQMRKAGEAWRGMSDNAKKPYEDKAAKDKERYEREKGSR